MKDLSSLKDLGLETSDTIIIGVVVLVFILTVRAFGSYFARFNNNINDFFFSGQRFSWWLPAASMVATGIGSYSFLKYSEQGYNTGMSSTMTYMNDWFAVPFFVFGWLPIIYFSRIKSVPEYFERRFNTLARYIALAILLAYMFFYIGYNFFTLGLVFDELFGISQMYSIPLIGIFIGAYVTFGGQTAVIFTDLFQGIMLYIAGFIAVFAGIYALGGFSEWWGWLPETHRLPFVHLTENPKFNTAGLFWGEALAGSIAFGFMNQGFLMRYLSIKSVDEGRKAAFFNVLITLPVSAIIVGAVGWIAKALVMKQAATGGIVGYESFEITDTFVTFLIVCWTVVKQNPWVFGFVLSALLAALMSTTDTLINACAAVGIYDLYKPLIKKDADDAHYLKAARWVSVATTIIGMLLVIWFVNQDGSLMSIHYKGIMIIIPAIVTTIFLGAFWRRFTPLAACVSMIVGSVVTVMTVWSPEWIDWLAAYVSGPQNGKYYYMRALYGMLITGTVGVVITLVQNWFFPESAKNNFERSDGLTICTLNKAMENYKGGKPNHEIGVKVYDLSNVKFDESLAYNTVAMSSANMDLLKANDADLIYISDQRWHLGGLRSNHVKVFTGKGFDVNSIAMSKKTFEEAYLIEGKPLTAEKIF